MIKYQFDLIMMKIILSNFSNDSIHNCFGKMPYHIDSLLGFSLYNEELYLLGTWKLPHFLFQISLQILADKMLFNHLLPFHFLHFVINLNINDYH